MGSCTGHRSEGEEGIGCDPEELYSTVTSATVWPLSMILGQRTMWQVETSLGGFQ